MSNRIYLKEGDYIFLHSSSEQGRCFSIQSLIGEGGSAACYSAKLEGVGTGVLKEFYPLVSHSFIRNDDGQLIFKPDTQEENEKYKKLHDDYILPYEKMIGLRSNPNLATFIPPFEIYYGSDKSNTVYVWSPQHAFEQLATLCNEIHEHPNDKPEKKLVTALYSIESLAKCVCELHKEGLIHGDIKPENIGYMKRGNEILTQSIYFFDIDTIKSVYSLPSQEKKGTRGFIEPEITKANNLTDIFAIGATLFNAIIVTDNVRDNNYLYDIRFYDDLKELVDNSELIIASEINSHPHLRSVLTRILQKTLCCREDRYQSCEELLIDVKKALYYIIPAELSERGEAGEKWILADLDKIKAWESNYEKNSTLALQYHLYTHPLYWNSPVEKDTLDVLVVGCGKYGQKFLDLALQIAQMPRKKLNITIVSASKEDKKVYLSERPELPNFFNVDGSLNDDVENYGNIRFIVHSLSVEGVSENDEFFNKLSEESHSGFDYAFIAMGRDSWNYMVAQAVRKLCYTSFSWEGKRRHSKINSQGLFPVYVSDDISSYPFFSELERMAFNVHLIWNKNLNINFGDVRKEYRKPYNHNSCVSFVLSLKYKLFGIDVDMSDAPAVVAKAYLSKYEPLKNELIYLEHRRWVTEKLCLGYRATTDLDYCATGLMKDEKNKRHVCLVRSTSEMPLNSKEWYRANRKQCIKDKWDHPSSKDLDSLDELDRMSVELHMMFLRHAELEREQYLLDGHLVSELRGQIEDDNECVIAFQELITCMKDIWDNDIGQYNRYKGLKKKFSDKVKKSNCLHERNKVFINKLLDSLHKRFFPIWESTRYRDYKMDDVDLVEGIPFILTYSNSIYMAVPFKTGTNDEIFTNLAAATHVNPSVILYYTYCSCIREMEAIKKTLPYIFSYMKKKEFRARVELIIGHKDCDDEKKTSEITRDMMQLSEGRLKRVKLIESSAPDVFAVMLNEYLNVRSKKKQNFLVECDAVLASVVGNCPHFSTYTYNAKSMEFVLLHDADIVSYIKKEPFITVTDMFSLKQASSETSNKPEFLADYKKIWQMYKDHTEAWKSVCTKLNTLTEKNDIIATFKNDDLSHTKKKYRYIIPFKCKRTTKKILTALNDVGIISEFSCVRSLTTNSCEVIIEDLMENRVPFDMLFTKVYKLMDEEYVKCIVDPKNHIVKVGYDDLFIANIVSSGFTSEERIIVDYLASSECGYLVNFRTYTNNTISFSFATKQIKDMLTIAGRFLEIYVYSKAYESGCFDDVRSGFEIDWKDHIAKNEFDAIMTKGFSTLIVECKATKKLKREYYDKLSMLLRNFGINAKGVIVADTVDTPDTQEENNRLRAYGEEQGIITISNRSDIGNIGMVLLSLIKK